jgi:GNAT superfamily N-acetyltransferase
LVDLYAVHRRHAGDEWLAEPDAFVLIAEIHSDAVGYALVHMRGPEETWATRGTGTALVEAVHRRLDSIGVGEIGVSVIASNREAVRFYEGLGLLPFLVSHIGPVPGPPTRART